MASPICTPDDPTGLGELYRQVNAGPGTAAIEPAVTSIGRFAPALAGSADRINSALRGTGISWQGRTADAAAEDLAGVARWASAGGDHAGAGGSRVQAYADSFAELRAKVAGPEPVPPLTEWDSVWETFGVTSDHGRAVAHNHQAVMAALDALEAHQRNTDQAITSFPDIAGVPGTAAAAGGAGGGHPGSAPAGGPSTTGAAAAGLGTGGANGAAGATTTGTATTGTATTGTTSTAGAGSAGSAHHGAGASGPGPGLHPGGPTAGPWPLPAGYQPRGPRPDGGTAARPDAAGGRLGRPPRAVRSGDAAVPASGSGGRAGGAGPEPAPRAGASTGRGTVAPALDRTGGPGGSRAPGTGGYGPMMGGAPTGGERTHRNQHFIPSDEPFVVQFDDVAPPVLGAGPTEDR